MEPGSTEYLNAFVKGYVEAALWADAHDDTEDEITDAHIDYGVDDLDQASLAEVRERCEDFIASNLDDLRAYGTMREYDPSQGPIAAYAGHDLWLTHNRHGAGFWDRGLGEVGERLTANAKPYGEHYAYIARETGVVYIEG